MSSSTTCSPTPATDPTCPTSRTGSSSSRATSATRRRPRRRCGARRSTRSSTSPPSRTTPWPSSTRACSSAPTCSGPRPCSRRPARPAWPGSTTSRPARSTGTCRSTPTRSSPRSRPTGRARPYNASKAGADHAVRAYAETYGLPITITNCANNYGPYQFPEKLIPHFCALALDDQPLTLYASTENRREWLHVVDHCRAIDAVLRTGQGRARPTTWAAASRPPSWRSPTGSSPRSASRSRSRRSSPTGPGHDRRYLLDASKIRRELGLGALRRVGAGPGRHGGLVRRRTGTGGSRCVARAPVVEGAWGAGARLSGADPDHRGRRAARAATCVDCPGRAGARRRACAARCSAPRGRVRGSSTRCSATDIDTMPVDDRDAVAAHLRGVPPRARPPRRRLHRGRPVRDRGRHGLRRQRDRDPPRRRGGGAGGRPPGLRLDRLRLRRDGDRGPTASGTRPCPTSVYGASKLAGERECRPGSTIVRTSWVCGAHGANMVRTVLRLADGDGELRFVDDQHGSPTFTADLAPAIVTLGLDRRPGHLPRDQQRGDDLVRLRAGRPGRGRRRPRAGRADRHRRARPAPPAPRPANSVLDNMALRLSGLPALPDWQDAPGPARAGPAAQRGAGAGMSPNGRDARGTGRARRRDRGRLRRPARRRPRWPTSATASCWPSASRARLAALRAGRMPIVEEGLDDLVAEGVAAGQPPLRRVGRRGGARAPSSSSSACRPPRAPTGRPTCPSSRRRPRRSAPHLEPGAIVVNKSTVPVGSATVVEQVLGRPDVSVVSNPEFLREGTAVHDSLNPDRIVVGADDPQAAARVGELFAVDRRTADRHRRHDVGDHQVRLQRLPGHQAELRQRAGRPVRGGGRRRARRPARPRLRQAHRVRVPAPGPGLGRLAACPRTPGPCSTSPSEAGYDFSLLAGAIATNDEQLARVVAKVEAAVRRLARRGDGRRAGGSPSRPTPTTGATRPACEIVHRLVGARRDACRPSTRRSTPRRTAAGGPARAAAARRSLRGGHRRAGAGRAHRVGRVPLARLRPGARP